MLSLIYRSSTLVLFSVGTCCGLSEARRLSLASAKCFSQSVSARNGVAVVFLPTVRSLNVVLILENDAFQ